MRIATLFAAAAPAVTAAAAACPVLTLRQVSRREDIVTRGQSVLARPYQRRTTSGKGPVGWSRLRCEV